MKIGDSVVVRGVRCVVFKVHPFGTVDVRSPDGAQAFRVSGLWSTDERATTVNARPVLPSARALAVAFVRLLESGLTGAQMREIRRRNRRRAHEYTCASHDFCDANIVMSEAWEAVAGYPISVEDDAMVARWNEAWLIADPLLGGQS